MADAVLGTENTAEKHTHASALAEVPVSSFLAFQVSPAL